MMMFKFLTQEVEAAEDIQAKRSIQFAISQPKHIIEFANISDVVRMLYDACQMGDVKTVQGILATKVINVNDRINVDDDKIDVLAFELIHIMLFTPLMIAAQW